MKKIASLFLAATLFYNVLGLYTIFAQHQEQMWVNTMEKTDNSKFKIIELNINPYAYIVDSGFEEINEDIVIENKVYHVFKKRIINNVLKLYCLKNTYQTTINKNLRNFVDNQLIDNSSNKEHPSKIFFKSFIHNYIPNHPFSYDFNSLIIFDRISFSIILKNDVLDGFYNTHYPPPNMV